MRKLFSVCLATILSVSLFAPAVYGAEKSKQPEGFYGLEGKVSAVYLYDDTRMVAFDTSCWWNQTPLGPNYGTKEVRNAKGEVIDWEADNSYLTSLAPKPLTGELGKQLTPINTMEILLRDNTKYTYGFYENGITVAKGEPGKTAGKAVAYSVDKKAFQTLLKSVCDAAVVNETTVAKPTWLMVMRQSRVTKITVLSSNKKQEWKPDHPNFKGAFDTMQLRPTVKPGSMRAIKYKSLPKTGTLVTIDFNSKVRYTIDVKPETLTIYSSDRDYALRYDSFIDRTSEIDYIVKNPDMRRPVDTGKPVIYLYPTTPTDVSVKLGYKGQLATTIPAYEGGWNVTAYPDGRMVNKADGQEYPYLFWDGYDDTDWDFSKGFVVAGADSERFLQEKLAYMGLNTTERRDFLEYWLPYLQENAYNQISFATEQYEALAPLAISPAPDSLVRVFMTYRPLERPIELAPQKLARFERKGFTAVEWGGAHPASFK